MVLRFIISAAVYERSNSSLQGETALMKASSNGHLPVAEALIQAKADVNARSVSSCSLPVCVTHTSARAKRKAESTVLSPTSASLCVSVMKVISIEYMQVPGVSCISVHRALRSLRSVHNIYAALPRHSIISH